MRHSAPDNTRRKEDRRAAGFGRILSNNFFLLRIAWQEAPAYTLISLLDGAISHVAVFIEHIYMIGYIINAITEGRPFWDAALFIIAVFLGTEVFIIFGHALLNNRLAPVSTQRINRRIRMMLYEKAVGMDLKCYDDPDYFNDFIWALQEAPTRVFGVIRSISVAFGSVVNIAIAGGYILSQDKVGLIVVVISFVGILALGGLRNRLRVAADKEKYPVRRRQEYTNRILYLAEYAKEIRLNHVTDRLTADFSRATGEIKTIIRKRSGPLMMVAFLTRFLFETLLVDGFYLLYLLYRAIVLRAIPYGTMVTLYNSCGLIRGRLFDLSRTLPEFQEHSLYIEKIRGFLQYENTVKPPALPRAVPDRIECIEFRNVSFSYGKGEALRGVNMEIRAGQKIAIVGYNGAGKTTLIKLLLRLYDPAGGQILLNGTDIREYALPAYRALFGTVFQDYQLFAATVGENIAAGPQALDLERAGRAVSQGGFAGKLSELEQGYDTPVTREFDDMGVLLSGGEAQSLAISRSFYRDSPVIVLDEPSSALDPLAEYRLNQTMYALGREKTAVTISHRLSTTKQADCIYMFENGRVVEFGTHAQLMAQGGQYASMFAMQAEKYRVPVIEEV